MIPTPQAQDITEVADPADASASADESPPLLQIDTLDLALTVDGVGLPRFDRPLEVSVRQASLLNSPPWIRSLGKIGLDVTTQGWKFPTPPDQLASVAKPRLAELEPDRPTESPAAAPGKPSRTRLRPPQET